MFSEAQNTKFIEGETKYRSHQTMKEIARERKFSLLIRDVLHDYMLTLILVFMCMVVISLITMIRKMIMIEKRRTGRRRRRRG